MAYNSQLFIILATLALVAPSILATEFIVGDDKGWTINFDYQAWAQGKQFYVGDKLGNYIMKHSTNLQFIYFPFFSF